VTPARNAALDPVTGASEQDGAGRGAVEVILVTVLDHSDRGCRIASAARLETGTRVALDLAGAGMVEAEIASFDGVGHDCRFLEPLTDEAQRSAFADRPAVKLTIATSALDFSEGAGPPSSGKWPPLVRLAILLGGGTAAWLLVLWLVF